jgi:hypothetical protein
MIDLYDSIKLIEQYRERDKTFYNQEFHILY